MWQNPSTGWNAMRYLSFTWIAVFATLLWLVLLYDFSMIEGANSHPTELSAHSRLMAVPQDRSERL